MSLRTLKGPITGTRSSTRIAGPNVMNRTVVAAMSSTVAIEVPEVVVEAVSGKLNSIAEFYEVLADCVTHEMKSEDCFEILKSNLHLYKNDPNLMEKDKTNIIRVLYAGYTKMVKVNGIIMKECELLAIYDSQRRLLVKDRAPNYLALRILRTRIYDKVRNKFENYVARLFRLLLMLSSHHLLKRLHPLHLHLLILPLALPKLILAMNVSMMITLMMNMTLMMMLLLPKMLMV